MKKEFSFYEFVGVLTPSVTLLFFLNYLLQDILDKPILDFSQLGQSVVFIIIAYGIGHVLNSLGNLFESFVWYLYGGKPTKWIYLPQTKFRKLFDSEVNEKIKALLEKEFGTLSSKDYGKYAYHKVKAVGQFDHIDIFNGNVSLFRGLCTTFLILSLTMVLLGYGVYALIPFLLFGLSTFRMIRFATYYAKDIYRNYILISHKDSTPIFSNIITETNEKED